MSDWIIIPDYKVEDKPDQPIGVLAPNGKPIVRLPTPVGFTASQAKIYAVKS